jgi:hypothetical protein
MYIGFSEVVPDDTDVRLIVFSTIFTATNVTTQTDPTLTTHRIGISGPIVVARPKRCPQWAKRPHIRLTGSRAVTNRHTSEAQSPAPGTGRFEIGWVILEGQERSWGWVLGLSFLCSVVCFVSVVRSHYLCIFWLYNLVFK